jgi:hypothetical protein
MGLAMQKKFIKNIVLFLMSLLVLGIFFACMEEPTIAPSKVPFSVVRLGNLTTNMDAISISIDGEFPVPELQNLQKNTFTEYFDLVAGRRNFVITDPQTGDTLWKKQVEAISYEEQTMFYAGFYHPSIDTSTVGWINYSDAFTYISKDPPADHLDVYFVHAAGDAYKTINDTVRTDSSRSLDIDVTWTEIEGTDTSLVTETIIEEIIFGDVAGAQLAEGHYKFDVRRNEGIRELLISYEADYNAGKWTWHYITGVPSNLEIVMEENDPLPVRPK